jgi:hypothetical protein
MTGVAESFDSFESFFGSFFDPSTFRHISVKQRRPRNLDDTFVLNCISCDKLKIVLQTLLILLFPLIFILSQRNLRSRTAYQRLLMLTVSSACYSSSNG